MSLIDLGNGLSLRTDEHGVALVGAGMELQGDFSRLLPRIKQGVLQRELLVRAARIKGVGTPTAFDATAGLGEDAFLLAAAGFMVTMCEHDQVIAALLRDALQRAEKDERLRDVASRMQLIEADSVEVLRSQAVSPDVVYLDPMFPEKRKRSATNKKLQLFQMLERPCMDEEALVRAALEAHPRKVVIKRPLKGPHLGGITPSSSLAGKVVRYDIVVPPRSDL